MVPECYLTHSWQLLLTIYTKWWTSNIYHAVIVLFIFLADNLDSSYYRAWIGYCWFFQRSKHITSLELNYYKYFLFNKSALKYCLFQSHPAIKHLLLIRYLTGLSITIDISKQIKQTKTIKNHINSNMSCQNISHKHI